MLNYYLLVAWLACCSAGVSDGPFAGRWEGNFEFHWPDGRVSSDRLVVVLRQFGDLVEGSWGANKDIQNRFKKVTRSGQSLTLSTGGVEMLLALSGGVLSGEASFPGPGAPRAKVSLTCVESGNGSATGPERRAIAGNVEAIENFDMPQLGRKRRIWVYLPPNYAHSTDRYPVLYMQDGQNLFDTMTSDRGEWRVDETVESMTRSGKITPLIVVGIDHGQRYRALEYMPASLRVIPNSEGEKYAEFVVRTLKPYIDAHFRTLPDLAHTAVAGSSAGAQISFFLATEYPDVFSGLGALGFVMGRGAKENIQQWRQTHSCRPGTRMYLHVGDEENLPGTPNAVFVEHLWSLHKAVIDVGYETSNIVLDIQEAGHHNEVTWSERFPRMLEFLFPAAR